MTILGNSTQPASYSGSSVGQIFLTRVQATSNATVNTISGWIQTYNATWSETIFLIYNGTSSAPTTLAGQTASFYTTPDYVMGVKGAAPISTVNLVSGQYYWIGCQVEHDSANVSREGFTGINDYTYTSAGFGTIPSDLTGLSAANTDSRYGFYLDVTGGASYTIDSITSPLVLGSSGNSITTTNLGTLTSLTVGGKAVSSLSAPSGDGTFSIPAWTDGVQGFLIGSSQAVVAGDGTNTASSTVTVSPQAGYSLVTLSSVNTGTGYLGSQVSLSVGDQIIFPTAASLGSGTNYIDVDGGIYTDYAGSQILYKRSTSTGIVTQITLINGLVAPSKFALLWLFGM